MPILPNPFYAWGAMTIATLVIAFLLSRTKDRDERRGWTFATFAFYFIALALSPFSPLVRGGP